ncbi:hypothetical protein RLOatenuis_6550 [Rickettsiales bacterium]|nr:hypothetical protein RLOatenuis_6550 [Rickettsiales bacterium]
MISPRRLKEIGKYIENGGLFLTNLIMKFMKHPKFDLISNKENTDQNIKFGCTTLPSKYCSA